jgi:hypothetical protein
VQLPVGAHKIFVSVTTNDSLVGNVQLTSLVWSVPQ